MPTCTRSPCGSRIASSTKAATSARCPRRWGLSTRTSSCVRRTSSTSSHRSSATPRHPWCEQDPPRCTSCRNWWPSTGSRSSSPVRVPTRSWPDTTSSARPGSGCSGLATRNPRSVRRPWSCCIPGWSDPPARHRRSRAASSGGTWTSTISRSPTVPGGIRRRRSRRCSPPTCETGPRPARSTTSPPECQPRARTGIHSAVPSGSR